MKNLKLRLIEDNRVVGTLEIDMTKPEGYFNIKMNEGEHMTTPDSFDLGIKTPDGTWWFANDRFVFYTDDMFTLAWRSGIPEFQSDGNDSMIALPQRIKEMKRIGNIYEKEKA